jgi:hypothetical protein
MKVTIRKEEIKAVLSAYFRLDVTDFVIAPAEPSPLGKRIRAKVDRPLDMALKFGNVKALRNVMAAVGSHIGLQDAKWAIEHWLEFIAFVDEYNRLPSPGYGMGKEQGILK